MEIQQLRDYLKLMVDIRRQNQPKSNGLKYFGFEDFVITEGAAMAPSPFPSEYDKLTSKTKKECFKNAYDLACNTDLIYCEGYAYSIGFPMLHAWCYDPSRSGS